MKVKIVTIGEVDSTVLSSLPPQITVAYRPLVEDCRIGASLEIPSEVYDSKREQYRADKMLKYARSKVSTQGKEKVLTVTSEDLYSSGLNFVFGQADCPGSFALISLYRLNPEAYGQGSDEELFLKRAVKEAVHELGHTFGLGHCTNPRCVMSFSNSILDVDRKKASFCEDCQEKLGL